MSRIAGRTREPFRKNEPDLVRTVKAGGEAGDRLVDRIEPRLPRPQ